MSTRPVFVATHPRACSTAFERIFMTRRNEFQTVHEPFGDAFYYGPERLGARYEDDEEARVKSGFASSTYKTIFDRIERDGSEFNLPEESLVLEWFEEEAFLCAAESWRCMRPWLQTLLTLTQGKRVFIKDITHYLLPPRGQPAQIAPSLHRKERGVGTKCASGDSGTASPHDSILSLPITDGETNNGAAPPFPYGTACEPGNPTVVPREMLEKFHFTFLIRHPKNSIPSYWRCTIPPLDDVTGFYHFMPQEAGYDELRRVFDYLKDTGIIGPAICGDETNALNGVDGKSGKVEICIIDADDLLDDPAGIMAKYCASIGHPFTPDMLEWDTKEHHAYAKEVFEKWPGFHEDAICSKDLKPRQHKKKAKSDEQYYAEWVELYGGEAAKVIEKTVGGNVADYEYLKQFAVKA